MTQKQQKLRLESLKKIDPKSKNQELAFKHWENGNNLVLNGSAGTGKTFIALAMAFEEVLDPNTPYDKVVIVRSIVPTRDIGFLKGDEDEKTQVYRLPYEDLLKEIFQDRRAWEKLEAHGHVQFHPTSFVRGRTWDRAIVVVDEMQNLNGHELDSVITRAGETARLIFCGDYYQSDFTKNNEKNGLLSFLSVIQCLSKFEEVKFEWADIVRSSLVREYIMTKEQMISEGKIQPL